MKISAWTPRLIERNFDVRRVMEGDVRNKCLIESAYAKVHDSHTTCLKCFPWCYYTITRQAIPMARSYQYQWLCKISSKHSLEFTLCSELEFGCEMSWNWVLLKVNTCDFFNFRLISFPELKDPHGASGNNHSNMLSQHYKGPIFNDMKCHCGVYSSFCVFLKSWGEHFAVSKHVLF